MEQYKDKQDSSTSKQFYKQKETEIKDYIRKLVRENPKPNDKNDTSKLPKIDSYKTNTISQENPLAKMKEQLLAQ